MWLVWQRVSSSDPQAAWVAVGLDTTGGPLARGSWHSLTQTLGSFLGCECCQVACLTSLPWCPELASGVAQAS